MKSTLVLGGLALSAAALIAGCFGHAGASAEVDAPVVFHEEPTLVVVEPGIWVVRDYDYAVYYVDDYYWVYRDDRWYRSRTYDRGWVTVEVSFIPRAIVRRDHHAYVHYRGRPDAPTRKALREPGNDRDRARHPDDRHDAPPRRDTGDGPRPPERSDRDGPPRHDDRSGVNPRDDNDKRENHEKKDDKKRDDRGKSNQHNQRKDDKRGGHDKR